MTGSTDSHIVGDGLGAVTGDGSVEGDNSMVIIELGSYVGHLRLGLDFIRILLPFGS